MPITYEPAKSNRPSPIYLYLALGLIGDAALTREGRSPAVLWRRHCHGPLLETVRWTKVRSWAAGRSDWSRHLRSDFLLPAAPREHADRSGLESGPGRIFICSTQVSSDLSAI